MLLYAPRAVICLIGRAHHKCPLLLLSTTATHPLEDLLLPRVTGQNDVEGLAVHRARVDVLLKTRASHEQSVTTPDLPLSGATDLFFFIGILPTTAITLGLKNCD